MTISEKEKQNIEDIILQLYNEYNVATDMPIDVVAIARKKGFIVQRLNMDKDSTGMLLYSKNENIAGLNTNKLIAVKNGLPEEQSRFILAHELGHYSLFSNHTSIIAHRRYSRLNTSQNEQAADYFARALLMPKARIKSMIQTLKLQKYDDNMIICEIAKTFNVTESKAKIRFYESL